MNRSNISREFEARLRRCGRDEIVRVAVVLKARAKRRASSRSGGRTARQDLIKEAKLAAAPAVADIDSALAEHGGKRLADEVNALGTIAVETTVAGIHALARIPSVKAILEDQPLILTL